MARDDIEYADGGEEGPTGTYDTIDYEDDIDQLYSRVSTVEGYGSGSIVIEYGMGKYICSQDIFFTIAYE